MLFGSSGTSYDIAKVMAARSGSHLITDLPTRWMEIEIDRKEAQVDDGPWTPSAKAFGNVRLKYLEDVSLDRALELRNEGRLADMRSFLGTVWRLSASPDPFSRSNAENLAIELNERVREAEVEWGRINRALVSSITKSALAGMGAGIATGQGAFVAAVTGAAALAELGLDRMKRQTFKREFPAGFFLGRK